MSNDTQLNTLQIPGLRMTKQRREVYRVIVDHKNHPTASDVFERVQESAPGTSLATVYNCLETLVEHGAVKQVNFERESSRYCANIKEHGHFYDDVTGTIHDVLFKPGVNLSDFLELPKGASITNLDITLHGVITDK